MTCPLAITRAASPRSRGMQSVRAIFMTLPSGMTPRTVVVPASAWATSFTVPSPPAAITSPCRSVTAARASSVAWPAYSVGRGSKGMPASRRAACTSSPLLVFVGSPSFWPAFGLKISMAGESRAVTSRVVVICLVSPQETAGAAFLRSCPATQEIDAESVEGHVPEHHRDEHGQHDRGAPGQDVVDRPVGQVADQPLVVDELENEDQDDR